MFELPASAYVFYLIIRFLSFLWWYWYLILTLKPHCCFPNSFRTFPTTHITWVCVLTTNSILYAKLNSGRALEMSRDCLPASKNRNGTFLRQSCSVCVLHTGVSVWSLKAQVFIATASGWRRTWPGMQAMPSELLPCSFFHAYARDCACVHVWSYVCRHCYSEVTELKTGSHINKVFKWDLELKLQPFLTLT